jgi:hypothetical protein
VFAVPSHSSGRTRHISYRDNSFIVSCGHCLATAVTPAPQFLFEQIRHTIYAATSEHGDIQAHIFEAYINYYGE